MRSLQLALLALLGWSGIAWSAPPETRLTEGLRDLTPRIYALVGARVVVAPGQAVPQATIVVRDGRIEAVGPDVAIPADALVVPLAGKTVYPGFIDAFTQQEFPRPKPEQGTPYWNALVAPEVAASRWYHPESGLNAKFRSQGFVARLVAPEAGIIRGTSALVSTDDGPLAIGLLNPHAALHVHLYVSRSPRRITYPNSPMGAVALARQAFLDAAWYRDHAGAPPESNVSLEVLKDYLPAADRRGAATPPPLVIFDADTEQYLLRAEQFAQEFGLRAVYRGGGREYRRLREIATKDRTLIVPVAFPQPPNVASPEAALNAEVDDLMHWDLAPENPARLERAGVCLALTTHGLKSPTEFLTAVRKAIARGLPADAALRALTTTPAELFGVRDQLGAIAPGLRASFVVADGDLFEGNGRVIETWVNGRREPVVHEPTFDLRGIWRLTSRADRPDTILLRIDHTLDDPTGELLGSDRPRKLQHLEVRGERLTCTFDAEPFARVGQAQLSISALEEAGRLRWTGEVVWPDGRRMDVSGERESGMSVEPAKTPQKVAPAGGASFEVNYPLGAFGRAEPTPPRRPAAVLFRRGTIWTCGPDRVLTDADLLMVDGKIAAVGRAIAAPPQALVIDLGNRHLTPGLIDPHTHIATDGGVNETGRAITCQVRVGDFIDANDVNLYRQLAGGTTTAMILHGSACPIGGQGEIIKFRWGLTSREIRFEGAPPTVKFALGENVTKGPDLEVWRYPHSRMGVEQIHRDALMAAREYQRRWDGWQSRRMGPAPRRDLELECLAEVLAGKRWVHCHCYRQDEILAFLRVMEDFQVRVGCLHHVSEGYKVADAILRHGAMATSFTDWWAFKVETLDAIAYNGSFLHRAGVVTSFHSDDRELGRHLNHEAAKAMRYGQLAADEALKFVTLAPARQLRIDSWVGSLEPGKHADLVVWSDSPLSPLARCEQTWIDGRKYFDRDDDLRQRVETERRKAVLVQKVLASGETMMELGMDYSTEKESWDREDKYCRGSQRRSKGR